MIPLDWGGLATLWGIALYLLVVQRPWDQEAAPGGRIKPGLPGQPWAGMAHRYPLSGVYLFFFFFKEVPSFKTQKISLDHILVMKLSTGSNNLLPLKWGMGSPDLQSLTVLLHLRDDPRGPVFSVPSFPPSSLRCHSPLSSVTSSHMASLTSPGPCTYCPFVWNPLPDYCAYNWSSPLWKAIYLPSWLIISYSNYQYLNTMHVLINCLTPSTTG